MEEQAHHRYYNSVRWGDSYARTATVAVCQKARSVLVLIALMTLVQAVHQKLSSLHHAEMLAGVALQLQQGLTSAVK